MAYRVLVVEAAARDLREIVLHVSTHDPEAAYRLRRRLIEEIKCLASFPKLGRIVPELRNPALRELIRNPYRIIYRKSAREQIVEVLRFWHAARGQPKI